MVDLIKEIQNDIQLSLKLIYGLGKTMLALLLFTVKFSETVPENVSTVHCKILECDIQE